MTLVTRPLIWLLMLVTLLLAVGAFALHSEQTTTHSVGVIQAGNIIDHEQQLANLSENPVSGAVQIRMDKIVLDHELFIAQAHSNNSHRTAAALELQGHQIISDKPLPENIEAFAIDRWDPQIIAWLGENQTLKRFGVQRADAGQSVDLSLLSKFTGIEALDLGNLLEVNSLSALQQLPKLHTLKIGHVNLAVKRNMSQVAQLPALKTLYLPDVTKFEHTLNAVGELKHSDSLQNVYLPISLRRREAIASVQTALPDVGVSSNSFRPYRHWVFGVSIWFMLVAGTLGVHFCSQFQLPQAQLTPGYKNAHHVVAWAITILIILLAGVSVCCWLSGSHCWPTCAGLGLTLIIGIVMNVINMRFLKRKSLLSLLASLCWIGICVGLAIYADKQPLVLEAFLMGAKPVTTCIVTVLALIAGVSLKHKLDQACRIRYANGVPLVMSLHDIQRISKGSTLVDSKKRIGELVDVRQRAMTLAWAAGVVLLVVILLRSAFAVFLPGAMIMSLSTQLLHVTTMAVLWLCVCLVAMKWWHEMPYTARRITRPPGRARQVDRLLTGIRRDLVTHITPVAIAAVILAISSSFWTAGTFAMRIAASVIFAFSLGAVLYAFVVWALLVRGTTGALLLVVTSICVLSLITGILVFLGCHPAGLPPHRLLLPSTFFALTALVAVYIARRKFRSLEWARMM